MLGIGIASGLDCDRQQSIERKVDTIINRTKNSLKTDNLIGNQIPEKYYEINGTRAYVEVDGKPLEDYFLEKSQR